MNATKTFIVKDFEATDPKILKTVSCWYVTHTETGGWSDDKVTIDLHKDGTLCIANDSQWVFLDSKQVEILRRFLMGEPQIEVD